MYKSLYLQEKQKYENLVQEQLVQEGGFTFKNGKYTYVTDASTALQILNKLQKSQYVTGPSSSIFLNALDEKALNESIQNPIKSDEKSVKDSMITYVKNISPSVQEINNYFQDVICYRIKDKNTYFEFMPSTIKDSLINMSKFRRDSVLPNNTTYSYETPVVTSEIKEVFRNIRSSELAFVTFEFSTFFPNKYIKIQFKKLDEL